METIRFRVVTATRAVMHADNISAGPLPTRVGMIIATRMDAGIWCRKALTLGDGLILLTMRRPPALLK